MSRIVFIVGFLAFAVTLGATHAYADVGAGFGHSFGWFRDADGDGIPNGQDDDWLRPGDGTGYQNKNRFGMFRAGTPLKNGDSGDVHNHQYRHRKRQSDTGDQDRLRLRLGDGSCK